MKNLKCNFADECSYKDKILCLHFSLHEEILDCTTPAVCETIKKEVYCVKVVKEEETQATPPIAAETSVPETPTNSYGFCKEHKKWLVLSPSRCRDCRKEHNLEDCKVCEHYKLRELNLYLSRRLKKLNK